MHRMKNGEFQYLTSFKQGSPGSGFGMADSVTAEVIRNGRVLTGDWSDSMSDGIGMLDSVTAEII